MAESTRNKFKKISLRILFFLILISIVLVVNFTILIQAFYINFHTPDPVQSILTNANFGIRSRPVIADLIFMYSVDTKSSNSFLHELPLDTWESVAEIIFPAGWIQETTDSIIDSFWTWLNNPTTNLPEISINLSQPLNILRSQQGALAVLPILQNIPFCKNEIFSLDIFSNELPECLPANINYVETSQMIAMSFSNSIIEEVDLTVLNSQGYISQNTIKTIYDIQNIYSTMTKSRIYALVLSVLLFLIYCGLKLKQSTKMVSSIFLPLILAGLFSFFLIFIVWAFMHWGWNLFITFNLIYLDSSIFNLINDLGIQLSNLILKSWLIYTSIFFIVTLLLWSIISLAQSYYGKKVSIQAEFDNKPHRTIKKQFR